MAFDEETFMNITAAACTFGVALYIYDTRKESVKNAFNSYTQSQTTPYQQVQSEQTAGSRKNRKKNLHKKTKKH